MSQYQLTNIEIDGYTFGLNLALGSTIGTCLDVVYDFVTGIEKVFGVASPQSDPTNPDSSITTNQVLVFTVTKNGIPFHLNVPVGATIDITIKACIEFAKLLHLDYGKIIEKFESTKEAIDGK